MTAARLADALATGVVTLDGGLATQLEAQGHHVDRRMIDLHEPIKALGVYRVPVKLHADVKPEIRVWVIKA